MSHVVYRSAITGRYVTPEYAAQHPDTTISEQVTAVKALIVKAALAARIRK